MRKRWIVGILIGLALGGCSRLPAAKNKQGALQVTSNGAFGVYLDETFLGQTPFFDEKIAAGEYTLRLVPSSEETEGIWQVQTRIAPRALTVVHYEWGGDRESSTSDVLELEPLGNKEAVELSLSTLPDNVVVKLDGELQGFSPVAFDDISAGDHVLALEAPGYKSKTINLKTNAGYRLRVTANLARDPRLTLEEPTPGGVATQSGQTSQSEGQKEEAEVTPSPTPGASPTPTPEPASGFGGVSSGIISGEVSLSQVEPPYVKVLDTGLGWLRVRSEPSGFADNEVAKIKVGTYFPFVEYSGNDEWVKLEYQTGKEGWASGKYVQVVEE